MLESLALHAARFLLEGAGYSRCSRVLLVLRWLIGVACSKVESQDDGEASVKSQDDGEASVDIHRKRHFRLCRVPLEVHCLMQYAQNSRFHLKSPNKEGFLIRFLR